MSARWGEPDESWPSAIRALVAALIVAVAIIILLGITAVEPADALTPDERCKACSTARPTPIVVGITPRPEPTTGQAGQAAPVLLPDTSTDR